MDRKGRTLEVGSSQFRSSRGLAAPRDNEGIGEDGWGVERQGRSSVLSLRFVAVVVVQVLGVDVGGREQRENKRIGKGRENNGRGRGVGGSERVGQSLKWWLVRCRMNNNAR